jgi:hypothetical protein
VWQFVHFLICFIVSQFSFGHVEEQHSFGRLSRKSGCRDNGTSGTSFAVATHSLLLEPLRQIQVLVL